MDYLARLDQATLAAVTGFAGLVLGITMLGIRWAGMRNPATLYWSLAGFAFGLGHQIGHYFLTMEMGAPRWIVIASANGAITFSHALLLAGARAYLGRPTWIGPLLALAGAIALTGFVWPRMQEDLATRVYVLSVSFALLDAMAAIVLWRARAPGLTAFHRLVAAVLLFDSVLLAARVVRAATSEHRVASVVEDPYQAVFFISGLIFMYLLCIALSLLMFRTKEIELRQLALRDPTTGLRNRRAFQEDVAREQARAERYGVPLSLIAIDIDHFKAVNDEHGHAAGDRVLRETANRIAALLRDVDGAYRLGGEEFAVVLPATNEDGARIVAERLRTEIATNVRAPSGKHLTASFGVAELVRGEEDWEAALRRADAALYEAKRAGRNCIRSGMRPRRPIA